MTITRKKFYGNSLASDISGDFTLPVGKRLHMITPDSGSLAARVPDSKFTRDGGPIYYVFNMSDTYSLAIKSNDGLSTLETLAVGDMAIVMHRTDDNWEIIKKTFDDGPETSFSPVEYSFSIGPGLITNFDLRDYLDTEYLYDGTDPVDITVTVVADTIINSADTATAAFDTGTFPGVSSMTLVNNGTIQGMGGEGGTYNINSGDGNAGGHAITLQITASIDNTNGEIKGGGGGGGCSTGSSIGGGGGGAGNLPGGGGFSLTGDDGVPGTLLLAGFGARGSGVGAGGFPGCPGTPNNGWDSPSAGEAGPQGFAVDGGQYLTWDTVGYVDGPVVDLDSARKVVDIYVSGASGAIYLKQYCELCGWNGSDNIDASLIINSGGVVYNPQPRQAYIWGNLKTEYTVSVESGWPGTSTVTITNNGDIYGAPGWGGYGGRGEDGAASNAYLGQDGLTALKAEDACTVDNQSGTIYGGGGGGGGAGCDYTGTTTINDLGGCGGAGQGHPREFPLYPWPTATRITLSSDSFNKNGSEIDPDDATANMFLFRWDNWEDEGPDADTNNPASSDVSSGSGTLGHRGNNITGESPKNGYDWVLWTGNDGGDGGTWGNAGAAGDDGAESDGGAAGAAGGAVEGDSNITWVGSTYGTYHGSIT